MMRSFDIIMKSLNAIRLCSCIVAMVATGLLTSCSSSDDNGSDVPVRKGSRTVLMYICAENDLDQYGFFQQDFNELRRGAVSLRDDQYLIAYIDRYSNKVNPQIVRITKDTVKVVKEFKEDFYSTSPEKMKEIMKWVVTNFPSDSYALTLWGHSSGWFFSKSTELSTGNGSSSAKPHRAYGYDMGFHLSISQRQFINIPELVDAVEESMPKLDFIFFDCCNMQCAEVAYQFRNCTDYLIGAPSEIPGEGAPYDYVVKDFFLNKENVGKAICDDYNKYGNFGGSTGVPLSVIKTDAMENLAIATRNALEKFMPMRPEMPKLDSCIYYWKFRDYPYRKCMYDIRNIMLNNLSEEDFKIWDAALSQAIVYRMCPNSSSRSYAWETSLGIDFYDFQLTDNNYGGMSMFIPLEEYTNYYISDVENLNSSIKQMDWNNIIDWARFGW